MDCSFSVYSLLLLPSAAARRELGSVRFNVSGVAINIRVFNHVITPLSCLSITCIFLLSRFFLIPVLGWLNEGWSVVLSFILPWLGEHEENSPLRTWWWLEAALLRYNFRNCLRTLMSMADVYRYRGLDLQLNYTHSTLTHKITLDYRCMDPWPKKKTGHVYF